MSTGKSKAGFKRTKQRFSIIPAGVVWDVSEGLLSETDLRVAAVLGTMTQEGGVVPATRQTLIAEKCGLHRRTVNQSIAKLERRGWLRKIDPGLPSGVMGYFLRLDPTPSRAKAELAEADAEQGDSQGGVSDGSHETDPSQGGVSPEDHKPCDSSDHTVNDPFSSDKSPKSPSRLSDPPDPSCTGPEGRCASGPGSAVAGEGAACEFVGDWVAFRQHHRRIGGDRWAKLAGVRCENGRLCTGSQWAALDVLRAYGEELKAHGVSAIWSDQSNREVSL